MVFVESVLFSCELFAVIFLYFDFGFNVLLCGVSANILLITTTFTRSLLYFDFSEISFELNINLRILFIFTILLPFSLFVFSSMLQLISDILSISDKSFFSFLFSVILL